MGQAAATTPQPTATMAPAQRTPGQLPTEAPQKILRPGSLLDIRV
jgi:hypothetical protein